jgi:SnoaL-like polyketide cyclase
LIPRSLTTAAAQRATTSAARPGDASGKGSPTCHSPTSSVTVEQNVVAGDTSVNRYTTRGTDPATGQRYEVLLIDMIRVRDGKVIEHWALLDQDAMRAQLGTAPMVAE